MADVEARNLGLIADAERRHQIEAALSPIRHAA